MTNLRNPEYDGSMGVFEGYGEFDPDNEYSKAMDRTHTIDSIIALNPNFSRIYLNSKDTNSLHDLECALLENKEITSI